MSKWLDKLSDEHVQCRRLGHGWEIVYWYHPSVGGNDVTNEVALYQPPKRNTHKGDRIIVCSCLRCGTKRHDQIATNGELIRRKYSYAEDYLRPTDAPKPRATDLSKVMLDRLFKEKPAVR